MTPSSTLNSDVNATSEPSNEDDASSVPSLEKMGSTTLTQTRSSLESCNALPFSPILPNSPHQRSVKFHTNDKAITPVQHNEAFHFFAADHSQHANDRHDRLVGTQILESIAEMKEGSASAADIALKSVDTLNSNPFVDGTPTMIGLTAAVPSSTKSIDQFEGFALNEASDFHSNQIDIDDHLIQADPQDTGDRGVDIHFDTVSVTKSNGKVCLLSSGPLQSGTHEWSITIRRCDVEQQEIGIVGTADLDGIELSDDGVRATASLSARAVYGNELCSDTTYYCSFNRDNKQRCFKDLSPTRVIGWCTNDVLTVKLDLDRGRIKFLINGEKVRKTLSIQRDNVYHPFIAFAGDCQYALSL